MLLHRFGIFEVEVKKAFTSWMNEKLFLIQLYYESTIYETKVQVPTNHLLSFLNKPNDIKRNKSTSTYKSRVTESK
jgi:hypothetical protein